MALRPSPSTFFRALTCAVIAPALVFTAAPAGAQVSDSLDQLQGSLSGEDGFTASVSDSLGSAGPDTSTQILGSSGHPLFAGSTGIGSIAAVGISPAILGPEAGKMPDSDPSLADDDIHVIRQIDRNEALDGNYGDPVIQGSIDKLRSDERYEQWEIAYGPMKRKIKVEVYRAAGGGEAPNLYLLDGVGASNPSGFAQRGVFDTFKDAGVNVIVPTQGPGTMWADWEQEDDALGINKWETFITQDLPKVLAGDEIDLKHSGKTGIGGVSMGASAAMSMAVRHPGKYDAVAGISGCYETKGLGKILADFTVASRSGDIDNMWGEYPNETWEAHDPTINSDKLRGTKVFFSSATGAAAPNELATYDYNPLHYTQGLFLEQAVNVCTNRFHRALDREDIDHEFTLVPQGMHNWWTFAGQMPAAWESIRGTLGA